MDLRAIPSSVPLESTKAIAIPTDRRSIHLDGHALLVLAVIGTCVAFSIDATIFAYRCGASLPILVTIGLAVFSAPRISIFLCAGF